jgi:Tol biopolymer transport system component
MSTMTDTRTLPGPPESVYSWWGSNYAVSPDGRSVAFGSADQVGLINLRTGQTQSLFRFPVYHTYSEWVWVPYLSWSPDSQYLVTTTHGQGQSPVDEDSPVFDVWASSVDGKIQAKLASLTGMWAMPAWSPEMDGESQIVYGQAREPASSQNSLYDLRMMDRDGSNSQLLFPDKSNALRVPQVTWSPDASGLLFVKDGDIHLQDQASGRVHVLTDDGYSGVPRWSR